MLREQAHLRLEALEANRAKDEFIATLSHELRTPLQAVLGWAATLTRGAPDRQTSRAASAIDRNAKLLAQLLDDTLDLGRIAHGKLTLQETDVDIARLAEEVVETMRPTALDSGVTVTEETSGPPVLVRGDPIRLRQVLWNLLSNALKFTPAGGRIDMCTHTGQEWVELTVRDSGVGIAPELLPHLFERYRQGDQSLPQARLGLGLGLAIVKELVALHRGTITAESRGEGQGAAFIVRLPTARP
jgi:signal transduction histidine kinase